MGAPGTHARRPGTGQIRARKGGAFHAYLPSEKGRANPVRLGTFPNRHEATRALEAWLAQQRKQ